MQIITCHVRMHRTEERIFLDCAFSTVLNSILKKLPGMHWSATHKQWHMPMGEHSYNSLRVAVSGIAVLNNRQLKEWLLKNRQGKDTVKVNQVFVEPSTPTPIPPAKATPPLKPTAQPATAATGPAKIAPINRHILPALKQALILKAYSPSTLKTYLNEVSQFLQELKDHPADELTAQRIKDYLQYCFEKLHLSENTLHSRINALKFYYEQALKKDKFFWEVPRPKKPAILPKLLNEDEIRKLFKALTNKKHKAMLFTP